MSRIDKLTQQAVELGFYQQTKDQEAIARVRELHRPFQSEDGLACGICLEWIEEDFFTGYNQATYPCLTIKALDGANGSSDDVQKVVE